jgi:hypothetical protein
VRERPLSLLVLAAALAGCSSSSPPPSRAPEDSRDIDHTIDHTDDTAATEHSRVVSETARDSLARARTGEEEASRDKTTANNQLSAAKRRLERVDQRLAKKRSQQQVEESDRKVQMLALDRIQQKRDDLRVKGLHEDEIARLTDADAAYAELRMNSVDATLATVEKEVELCELERRDAQLEVDTANTRISMADQRIQASRALAQRAQQQAKVAEAEAAEAKRLRYKPRPAAPRVPEEGT